MSEEALRAVEAIVNDLEDRRGLGHIWGDLPRPIQEEIKTSWVTMVADRFAAKDATIKALSDTLAKHGRQVACGGCGGIGSRMCSTCDNGERATYHPEVAAALRLAGRLP